MEFPMELKKFLGTTQNKLIKLVYQVNEETINELI